MRLVLCSACSEVISPSWSEPSRNLCRAPSRHFPTRRNWILYFFIVIPTAFIALYLGAYVLHILYCIIILISWLGINVSTTTTCNVHTCAPKQILVHVRWVRVRTHEGQYLKAEQRKRLRETSDEQYLQTVLLDPLQRGPFPLSDFLTKGVLAGFQNFTKS